MLLLWELTKKMHVKCLTEYLVHRKYSTNVYYFRIQWKHHTYDCHFGIKHIYRIRSILHIPHLRHAAPFGGRAGSNGLGEWYWVSFPPGYRFRIVAEQLNFLLLKFDRLPPTTTSPQIAILLSSHRSEPCYNFKSMKANVGRRSVCRAPSRFDVSVDKWWDHIWNSLVNK